MSRLSRTLFAVCVAAVLCAPARPSRGAAGAADGQAQLPTLKPSNILDAVRQRKTLEPRLSAAGLARYANALIKQKGFDYNFDVCEIFPPEMLGGGGAGPATGALHSFDRPLTRLDGRGITFRFVADDYGSPCAECFLPVPALRVTKGEMHVVAGGVVYELKRPASFVLDEAYLVGADLKTVLRTWQLPYQTIPVGVSPDGKSLYVGFYEDTRLDELVLEISDDGRLRFRVTREAVSAAGEWIEERPPDSLDEYPSFLRFRAGGRTHVIRFSGPCT